METIILIAAAGAVGGLAKSLLEQKGAIALPGIETSSDGTKYVHLGGITNLILGAVVAVATVTAPIQGIFAGISSAFILEKLIEKI
jgi:NADPH:quinone reductase-like Zn-dependent oxidoreductase